MLPGYLEGNVPCGVCFYTSDDNQLAMLAEMTRNSTLPLVSPVSGEQPITGVYSMGSTSSIGQNANSDLDIWVCHQSWLDNVERAQLQRKCCC